jgi:hypothetical protein
MSAHYPMSVADLNPKATRARRVRTRAAIFAVAATLLGRGAIGTAMAAGDRPAVSLPAAADCTGALRDLLQRWNQAGFGTPGKPGQYRVYGTNGNVTDGPGYAALISAIRQAVRETDAGCSAAAGAQIQRASALLAATRPMDELPEFAVAPGPDRG